MSKNARTRLGPSAVTLAALAILVLAPSAAALPQPAVYFLRDTPFPETPTLPIPVGLPHLPVTGLPLGDGQLVLLSPPGLPPVPSNATDPNQLLTLLQKTNATQQRVIFPEQQLVRAAQFVSNSSANTGRIYGPVVVLLVLPNTPAMQNANLSVELVIVPKDASPTDLPAKGAVIASSSFVMDFDSDNLPNATNLVPPDPTNPPAALGYIQAQLLAYGFTQLTGSYKIAFLTNATNSLILNEVVDKESTVALRLVLEQGSSPAPIPAGAGQPVVYWNALTPSFVYVPWYGEDPARTTPTYSKSPSGTRAPGSFGGGSSGTGGVDTTTTSKKKTPGFEVPFMVIGLAALVLVARKRMG
ncbi:MAG TPA: hypothetical protein VM286_00660 [Candidatus Thermoplasmatota archaeon]|nr:hypothetical protein [Candidatus Thermoplasmatota archaeon]